MNKNVSTAKKVWLTILLGTISATGPLSIDLYLPALPQITQNLHTSASLMQLSLSACLFGLAIGQLIIGPLSDKYGRKIPLIIGFAVFSLSSLLIAFTNSIYLLIFLRLIQGLSGSSGQVLSRAIARDHFSGPLLLRFYSMLSGVNGIFPVISPIIGGQLVKFLNWRGIFFLLAIIGLIIILSIIFGFSESLPSQQRINSNLTTSIIDTVKLLINRPLRKSILVSGLVYGALFSYISASSFIFQSYYHLSAQGFSLIYALNGVGIAVGSLLPAKLIDRFSAQQQTNSTMLSILFTGTLLLLSWFIMPNFWLVCTLIFIITIQLGILLTLTSATVMNTKVKSVGGTSALMGLSQNAIGSIMSPVVGLMGVHTYLPMALAILICMIISYLIIQSNKKDLAN
ncbi:multidrug effflux MFS transporter [Lentilactobacillus laojiaonis]|uniref:multidrug effflux MFS transporter n=1 Tax=Lentilactobacillus laojiaonis TaxID=2883998 RepID=UPI001D0B7362|nr:multidrug effflux MFS transporter [Lentilactobacillus laojiaonis]UDM32180.1 multidrug effflux MFS transporter [Lentilactobacillus laojiaonis]